MRPKNHVPLREAPGLAEVGQAGVAEPVEGEAALAAVALPDGLFEYEFDVLVGRQAAAGVGAEVGGRGWAEVMSPRQLTMTQGQSLSMVA
ncbi:hypothetical protein ACFV0L_21650 [Streptosporangium canum]|uniref:hypothetical protein n=1 Tax=Streptosporangium canum TaxID=324952 RepID=UPI0036837B1F